MKIMPALQIGCRPRGLQKAHTDLPFFHPRQFHFPIIDSRLLPQKFKGEGEPSETSTRTNVLTKNQTLHPYETLNPEPSGTWSPAFVGILMNQTHQP
jgi:hypothetical protein